MSKKTKQNIRISIPPQHTCSDSFELMCSTNLKWPNKLIKRDTQKALNLNAIKNTYSSLIANDPILKSDFNKLLNCIHLSAINPRQDFNAIVIHMIEEIAESSLDFQRLADDGAVCDAGESAPEVVTQTYQNLKSALAEYYTSQNPV